MAPAELLSGSRWRASAGEGRTRDATSPFDSKTVGTVTVAGPEDVEAAGASARSGARQSVPAFARANFGHPVRS
ncbi:hypothetical protein OK074_3086 [Actinobacteria bacterium OK074]|nr:hypothetical protein OK074_3086 [Actinobacteria bacterium OK074]